MAITKVTNSVVGSGSATDGYVLTADGSGNSAWEAVAGGPTFKTFGTEGSIMVGSSSTGTINAANYNTGLGTTVFAALTTGDGNTGVGFNSLTALTTGLSNTAIGNNTLQTLTTASYNTAVGQSALLANTTGTENTAVGNNSLDANTIGSYNTACGKNALTSNTGGNFCSAFGQASLETNTTGENITAVGQGSLRDNTTASYNTAVGTNSLRYNTTGAYNTALGEISLQANTTGNFNVAVGRAALLLCNASSNTGVGVNSLQAVTSGANNTGLGESAGNQTSTGSGNTWLGANCKSTSTWGGASRIGANGFGTGIDVRSDYRVQIGYYTDYIYADYKSSATWNRISDERKKKNIENLEVGLDYINALRPVTYKWKAPSELPSNLEGYDPDNTTPPSLNKQVGLIAQEVKAVNDAHSLDFNLAWDKPDGFGNENEDGLQALSYENLIMPLIKAIQELSAEVETLKSQIGV